MSEADASEVRDLADVIDSTANATSAPGAVLNASALIARAVLQAGYRKREPS